MACLMLDLDGVLYPWHLSVYEYYQIYKGYEGSFDKFWGVYYKCFTEADWEYLINVDYFYSNQAPTDDCVNFLNIVKYRFDIYYVTGRPLYVKTTTEQFLRRYKFPFRENLIFDSDKANMARRIRADISIDDLPKNLDSLSKISKAIMIAQPYNKEYWDVYPTAQSLTGTLQYMEI